MDLDFSEEQQMLREMVRGVCNEYAPIAVVRAMEDDPSGYPSEFWKQLGELGLCMENYKWWSKLEKCFR